jgi:uncharacterized protein
MPKKLIKRWMPDRKKLQNHKHLRIFGKIIHDPNLWHLNRYSVATGFSVGLFVAFVPIPFQMVLAAAIAIIVRSNLPLSVALVWITNPLTMPPIFYFTFRVGAWILDREPTGFNFDLSFEWISSSIKTIGPAFFLGCFVCGTIAAIISNMVVRMLWRYSVSKNWHERRMKRRQKRTAKKEAKQKHHHKKKV